MGLFDYLANKLKRRRYALQSRQQRKFVFGAVYSIKYRNWKNDPTPLVWCQYGGMKTGYFHGININYLSFNDKRWLARLIYLMARGGQIMDGLTFYKYLKQNRPSIVKTAYRTYFTNMIMNPKLVAFGINASLYQMTYPFNDPWVKELNAKLMPQNVPSSPQISYNEEELRTRILQSQNTIDVRTQRVGGKAPYLDNTNKKAGWLQ